MEYTKPEIVINGQAIRAIQHGNKPSLVTKDNIPNDETQSDAAYEADE